MIDGDRMSSWLYRLESTLGRILSSRSYRYSWRARRKVEYFPGRVHVSLKVVLAVDTSTHIPEEHLEEAARRLFKVVQAHGGQPILVIWPSDDIKPLRVYRDTEVLEAVRRGRRDVAEKSIRPLLEALRQTYFDVAVILSDWKLTDLQDEATRQLLWKVAYKTVAATTDALPPDSSRFLAVVRLEVS
jgi:predicted metal-dependent peptidase